MNGRLSFGRSIATGPRTQLSLQMRAEHLAAVSFHFRASQMNRSASRVAKSATRAAVQKCKTLVSVSGACEECAHRLQTTK